MSSPPSDPYAVLGVSRDAQVAEIRSAHRKLVLQCHPDKVQDPELKAKAQDEFQKVQQAYEVLNDEDQRAKCDDKLKLAELRAHMANRANSSAPRSSPKVYAEFEIRTAEPPREFRESRSSKNGPPPVKIYSYPRSYEDDSKSSRGARYYEFETRNHRREPSRSDKASRREAEREREAREKEKERERRRVKKEAAEDQARQERAEKLAKKEKERKAKDKQRSKDQKRDKDEKRRDRDEGVYIDPYDDEPPPPPLPRKTSSKRHDEKRERSSHRDDMPPRMYSEPTPIDAARAYIHRSRDGPERSKSYHSRAAQPPTVPTPPPAGAATYAVPDDEDIRRSSAPKVRRGSTEVPTVPIRERSYRQGSKEPLNEPHIVSASPPSRHTSTRYASGAPVKENTSPPRGISRTNTMPEPSSTRYGMPRRAATYSESAGGVEVGAGNRGRNRSKMYSQLPEEDEESEEEQYEERPRRSTKDRSHKTRSSERQQGTQIRYAVDGGRTKLQSSQPYTRNLYSEPTSYYAYDAAYPTGASPPRPPIYRQPSSSTYVSSPYKVRTSKYDNVSYSSYGQPHYNDEYATVR